MSGKMYCMIPVKDRPYEWARREMEEHFPNPDKFHITELDQRTEKPNVHVPVFHRGEDEPAIWRVYWADTDSVKYSILTNYRQLKLRHPELVKQLERNGKWAYEQMIKNQKGKITYKALQPFAVTMPPFKKTVTIFPKTKNGCSAFLTKSPQTKKTKARQ